MDDLTFDLNFDPATAAQVPSPRLVLPASADLYPYTNVPTPTSLHQRPYTNVVLLPCSLSTPFLYWSGCRMA
jgi:hypothetical protein